MKKPLHLLILMLFLALVQTSSAQWVTIPDQSFRNYLTNTMPQCMNGDQLNTQCPAVLNLQVMNIQSGFGGQYNVGDLTGLEHFSNLETLILSFHNLHTIPAFPASLKTIRIWAGGSILSNIQDSLTYLPPLPPLLEHLEVNYSSFISMPELPASLVELKLDHGDLEQLPALPVGLTTLIVSSHQGITSIPSGTLPPSLEVLNVSNCSITTMPTFPSTLKFIDVSHNPIGTLPQLPAQLEHLNAKQTQISFIPELPSTLQKLFTSNNPIGNLPALPEGLKELECSYNQLNVLPELPLALEKLVCEWNSIASFPPLPPSLKSVEASFSGLQILDAFPESMESFTCQFCNLSQLPSLPAGILKLEIPYNDLVSLPELPDGIVFLYIEGNELSCLPHIPMSLNPPPGTIPIYHGIHLQGNPLTCVPNYLPENGNFDLGQYPICAEFDTDINPFGCAAGSEGIYGRVFLDDDSNCAYTSGEPYIYGIPVKIYDPSGTLLSQMNSYGSGLYSFYENYGNYDVKIDTANKPFTVECASIGVQLPVSTSLSAPLSQNNNFALKCKPGYDIAVNSITRSGWIFPGQQHIINLNAGDVATWFNINCSDGTEAQVTFTVDGPVQYVEPYDLSPAPDVISGNTFTFNLGDVADWGNTQIRLLFETDTTAQADDLICVDAYITPDADDLFPANNFKNHCFPVVNSYDPNMKEVWPVDVLPGYDGYFTYTIHFQNTGSAPAFNIKLRDTLSSLLDLNTFEVVHSSHPHTMTLNGQHLRFFFNNIMLPDSTSNEPESKGYVQYRVKPLPGLAEGSVIENTAYIYFDFNEPIITNTTANQFIQPLGTGNNQQRLHARIWPNPGNGKFYLSLPANEMGSIEVFDIAGRKVHSQISEGPQTELELSHLPTGLYMAKILQSADMATVKIVKQ